MVPTPARGAAMPTAQAGLRSRAGLAGVLAMALAILLQPGCASRNFEITAQNREAVIDDFATGRIELTCQIPCIWADTQQRERMAELYKIGRWEALVRLVIETGWDIDRNHYFLGRAAEQLGAPEAAMAYYRRAIMQLQRGQCRIYSGNVCVGIDVPRRANERLAMLQRLMPASARR